MSRRKALAALLAFGGLIASLPAFADQRKSRRQYRIGLLPDLNTEQLDWFARAMGQLGWAEGRDFVLVESGIKFGPHAEPFAMRMVVAPSQSSGEGISQNTKRVLAKNPDLILATSTAYAVAAHRASETVPVVMWTGGYPVEAGIANSLARPGKNVTGASIYAGTGIWGKLLELLAATKPTIKIVGVLWDYLPPAFPAAEMESCYRELRKAEAVLGLKVRIEEVGDPDRLASALRRLDSPGVDALVVTSGWGLLEVRQDIMDYVLARRLPVIVDFRWRSVVDPFPLLVYGAAQHDLMRDAAAYVVKILDGAKPGELPVLQPSRFELVVNRQTAKRIGLEIPGAILLRADHVIE